MNIKLELTLEEAQVLVNILDIAVKSRGLEVSKAVDFFVDKIKSLAIETQKDSVEPILDKEKKK